MRYGASKTVDLAVRKTNTTLKYITSFWVPRAVTPISVQIENLRIARGDYDEHLPERLLGVVFLVGWSLDDPHVITIEFNAARALSDDDRNTLSEWVEYIFPW